MLQQDKDGHYRDSNGKDYGDHKDTAYMSQLHDELNNTTHNTPSESSEGGCFSTILGIAIIIGAIILVVNFGFKKTIIGAVIVLIVIPVTIRLIISYLRSQKENARKMADEAWQLIDQGKPAEALEKAERAASYNCDAADLAGLCYKGGTGCDKDIEKAFSYFEMGMKGNMEARAQYGLMLMTGEGCEKDEQKGKKELIKALVEGHNTFAALKIGEFQLEGKYGWKKDVGEAMKNLQKASEDGWQHANFLIGKMMFEGVDGVQQDREKGLSMIQEAAESGCSGLAEEYLTALSDKTEKTN